MIAVKQSLLAKTMYPQVTEACVFYMDLRTWGKASETYARQAEAAGVRFVRARVHSLAPGLSKNEEDTIQVVWLDPSGERKESKFDLVVLAPGQHPDAFLAGFAKDQELAVDDWGFVRPEPFLPAHTSRPGIFACGGATGPKDIHDSVTGATAAALSAMQVMAGAGRGRVLGPGSDQVLPQGPGQAPKKAPDQGPDRAALSDPRSGGVSIFPGALVIGGGIAGMTAALAIADQGFEVDLVEQTQALGGNLVWLQSGIQGGADFLEQQIAAVHAHERIRVHTCTRAAETMGRPGRWVTLLTPVMDTVEDAAGNTDETTIAQTTDAQNTDAQNKDTQNKDTQNKDTQITGQADAPLSGEKAGKASPGGPAKRSPQVSVRHGVVVLAVGGVEAGHDTPGPVPDPGTGLCTQQQFQQALDRNEIDTKSPLQVAMVQCHGSREPGREYCSRVCCQRSLDQAMQLKSLHPDTRVVIFYRDMMTPGLAEAAYTEARKNGVVFVPYESGNAPDLKPDDTGYRVTWTDPILGRDMEMGADYVVLAKGIRSSLSQDLARMFGAGLDRSGFFDQADIKWRPVEAIDPRVLACGICLEPGSLGLTLASARAAAAKAAALLGQHTFFPGKDTARVRPAFCSLCRICIDVCPFNARFIDSETRTLMVDPLACQGCGICAAACPSGAAVVADRSLAPMMKTIHAALNQPL
jgi:heterodisulfide reductase subunit A-like polyferredoxin